MAVLGYRVWTRGRVASDDAVCKAAVVDVCCKICCGPLLVVGEVTILKGFNDSAYSKTRFKLVI